MAKRRKKRPARTAPDPSRGRERGKRPAPVEAIQQKHSELAERLSARPDRFSQLLSQMFDDEMVGRELLSRSGLNHEEHAEALALADEANTGFEREMDEVITNLRELLSHGDPLYSLALVQASNVAGGWGTYYPLTRASKARLSWSQGCS